MNEEEMKAINNMKLFARVHQDMAVVTAEEMDIVLKFVERLQKENEELLQEKINNQKIIVLAQNDMLNYQAGFEDGKNGRTSAVQSIIENQQYYIFQKQIEKYERHIEKLQKENEELKQELKTINKGINSLMQSRKKWRHRYYKMKDKNKDLQKSVEQIFDDYQDIGKIVFDCLDKIKKQDKIIDLIIKELYKKAHISTRCYLQTSIELCMKHKNCYECLKQHFENKVKENK